MANGIKAPRKLIEVALPLDAINAAAAREKSIRHGHPSTLHLWWARRPLAAARAVLFAQLVNDPGGERGWGKYKGQSKEDAERERKRLFDIIEKLVRWENTNNEDVLAEARAEIWKSWRETCEMNKGKPGFDPERLPPFHDPFAGGGAIPLEAQRLGLEAHASDLNPVAVLINKAMIEIPPKFAGRPPVGPEIAGQKQTKAGATEDWSGARGLAEDVRRYGAWMRDEAYERIGHLYPKVKITKQMAKDRPDLERYVGKELTVIAWLWARTVASPNPAFDGVHVPLVASFWLSKKKGQETWVEPVVAKDKKSYQFRVVTGGGSPAIEETINRKGATCLLSGSAIALDYIRAEAKADRMNSRLMAIVAEGERGRVFLDPILDHEQLALGAKPDPAAVPNAPLPGQALGFRVQNYGITNWAELFTSRQQVALITFCELVGEARARVPNDAKRAGSQYDAERLADGGSGAIAYGDAIIIYLSFILDKISESQSVLCTWSSAPKNELVISTFRRQALPMVWDFAEANPFALSSGSIVKIVQQVANVLDRLPVNGRGQAIQADAQNNTIFNNSVVVSTDPPYYDNVGYADLSDYFYVWMRRNLRGVIPNIFGTLLTPKEAELIAAPYRHDNKDNAEKFFLSGMTDAMRKMAISGHPAFPVTIYYAFKQSETKSSGTASTGWETFLDAVLRAGFSITGTWPMHTERSGRSRDVSSNALASSIVLVCRKRAEDAPSISRRQFLRELNSELPVALEIMIGGKEGASPIAPVDLAQAAIGPGMAIFSKYSAVLEADGEPMRVHSALIHINKAIDEYFADVEGDMDADTRFCVDWFQQHGFEHGPFGTADVLARAKGTSVDGVARSGVVRSRGGKVELLDITEYAEGWDPTKDDRMPVWEACHQLCRALQDSESAAGLLLSRMPDKQAPIRQLAYRLYTLCERKGWAKEARHYNELITSWDGIVEQSRQAGLRGEQTDLRFT